MDRLKRIALVGKLILKAHENDCWCGETQIQRAIYILQNLLKIEFELEFVFYRHGPFSFDLRNQLAAMQADYLIEIVPTQIYGPRYVLTELGEAFVSRFSQTISSCESKIIFVTKYVAEKGPQNLDVTSTALFYALENVRYKLEQKDAPNKLAEIKPYISYSRACFAVKEAFSLLEKTNNILNEKASA